MMKKQQRSNWQQARIPKIRPVTNPDWYKRFRQLAKISGNISGSNSPNRVGKTCREHNGSRGLLIVFSPIFQKNFASSKKVRNIVV
jgi:hypothetical protein